MQPLRLTIPGEFYDSQIYAGRLHLWEVDHSIRTYNWDELIDSLAVPENLNLAVQCGFRRSDYLYGSQWDLIFQDKDIRSTITKKFSRLATHSLEMSSSHLTKALVDHQSNPINFPHSDSVIYGGRLYVAGQKGVWRTSCNKGNRHAISTRPNRIWDCPILSIAAAYGSLALSAGDEGLYEQNISDHDPWWAKDDDASDPKQLSATHSSSSHWTYYSVFSSSYKHSGYLADFDKESAQTADDPRFRKRVFRETISAEDIFHSKAYSWGVQDKLCQFLNGELKVIRYSPWYDGEQFEELPNLELSHEKGGFVSAESSTFGYIVEFDGGLSVVESDGSEFWIKGEPVSWRVFPKSKHYANHLHVIYDDRLVIYSFNSDYFVDQDEKIAGIKFNPRTRG